MDEEQVLDLFDVYWFYHSTLPKPPASPPRSPSPPPTHPKPDSPVQKPSISSLLTLHRRSLSDHSLSKSDPFSPSSVLPNHKLDTILSGKESEITTQKIAEPEPQKPSKKALLLSQRNKKLSKSLSDLEFEELKGFLDLGFEFPETEVDSRLISIVPGLQRLRWKEGEEQPSHETPVSRPYLSEAWGVNPKKQDPLANWKIPAVGGGGTDMKDQLRFWAHAVASTVR